MDRYLLCEPNVKSPVYFNVEKGQVAISHCRHGECDVMVDSVHVIEEESISQWDQIRKMLQT